MKTPNQLDQMSAEAIALEYQLVGHLIDEVNSDGFFDSSEVRALKHVQGSDEEALLVTLCGYYDDLLQRYKDKSGQHHFTKESRYMAICNQPAPQKQGSNSQSMSHLATAKFNNDFNERLIRAAERVQAKQDARYREKLMQVQFHVCHPGEGWNGDDLDYFGFEKIYGDRFAAALNDIQGQALNRKSNDLVHLNVGCPPSVSTRNGKEIHFHALDTYIDAQPSNSHQSGTGR